MSLPVEKLKEKLTQWGAKIECLPDKLSPETGYGSDFAVADWHEGERTYRIYYRSSMDEHQLYHELLHLQWFGLLGAGAIHPHSYLELTMKKNIVELNNDLDHAQIIPQEVSIYPEAASYWEADFTRKLSELNLQDKSEDALRKLRVTLFRGWLVIPHFLVDSPIKTEYHDLLAINNWLDSAELMTKAVQTLKTDKLGAMAAFREGLGLNFPRVELYYRKVPEPNPAIGSSFQLPV